MATQELLIAPHRFAVGYHRQTFWNWLIGTAFFLGGLGGGLFLVSLLTGHVAGMVAGFLIVVVGKNTAHLLFLGRPERFLAAARRPDRSWIARGIWAMGIFMVTGSVTILLQAHVQFIHLSQSAANVNFVFAAASALFIACYDGFLMRSSAGVAFWRTLLLPLLLFMYASLGGVTLSLTIREFRGEILPAGLRISRARAARRQLASLGNLLLPHEPVASGRSRNPRRMAPRNLRPRVFRPRSAGGTSCHLAAVALALCSANVRVSRADCRLRAHWRLFNDDADVEVRPLRSGDRARA